MSTIHVVSRVAFPRGDQFPRSRSPIGAEPEFRRPEGADRLAGFLGWFSLGLGITALAAPKGLARFIGASGDHTDRAILRLVGLQELVCGLSALDQRPPRAAPVSFLNRGLAPPQRCRRAGPGGESEESTMADRSGHEIPRNHWGGRGSP